MDVSIAWAYNFITRVMRSARVINSEGICATIRMIRVLNSATGSRLCTTRVIPQTSHLASSENIIRRVTKGR